MKECLLHCFKLAPDGILRCPLGFFLLEEMLNDSSLFIFPQSCAAWITATFRIWSWGLKSLCFESRAVKNCNLNQTLLPTKILHVSHIQLKCVMDFLQFFQTYIEQWIKRSQFNASSQKRLNFCALLGSLWCVLNLDVGVLLLLCYYSSIQRSKIFRMIKCFWYNA